mgnify:CR=1 FL=1
MARRAFAQESLKSVTSPTSVGLLTFWHTFFHIKICLRTGSRGTPHFSIFFNARLSYLKQYCRYQCPKSGPNRWRRTHTGRTPHTERTDAHQKFEASCTKALRAIIFPMYRNQKFQNISLVMAPLLTVKIVGRGGRGLY